MNKIKNAKFIPLRLKNLLDKKRKVFFIILLFMSVFHSLIEAAGISIIMPFINVASNPEVINEGHYKYFYKLFNFSTPNSFVFTFAVIIILFYLFRSFVHIFYIYIINKFSYGTYRFFGRKLFKTYLALPYKSYVQKNPSVFIQMISGEASNLSSLLNNILNIITESFTVILLYVLMLMVNWQMTLVLTACLTVIITIMFYTLIKKSKQLGHKRYEANVDLSKLLWQTFGNYKFVKLKGNEEELLSNFNKATHRIQKTNIISNTLGTIPKGVLENLGFSLLIGSICYILWRYNTPGMIIPIVSMYALALYRMLPAINRMLNEFNKLAYNQHSLQMIDNDLNMDTDKEDFAPVPFNKNIICENIYFSYLTGGEVIKNVSLEIKKGEKIAITGESGSGKTTLVDIIIGIYRPLQGKVLVDGIEINETNIKSWRNKIGYIPQSIYLFDGTVAENVCFGSDMNEEKVIKVLKNAKIWDFLQTKQGINTLVGEGGIQLSGGQKQRIGIARALYSEPEILVLDEATSSLDDTTEEKIMEEIYDISGNKTLIVIAHRLSTVERCDRRIYIENGKII